LRDIRSANKFLECGESECLAKLPASRNRKWAAVYQKLWDLIQEDSGQDIAEYAIMLAVILIIVVGTVKLIGGNANNTFSNVASSLQ
jgi:Flp pilus assembly pilin Flp